MPKPNSACDALLELASTKEMLFGMRSYVLKKEGGGHHQEGGGRHLVLR